MHVFSDDLDDVFHGVYHLYEHDEVCGVRLFLLHVFSDDHDGVYHDRPYLYVHDGVCGVLYLSCQTLDEVSSI